MTDKELLKFKLWAERRQEEYQAKRWVYTQRCLREFKEWQAALKASKIEEQQPYSHDGEGQQNAIEYSQSYPPAPPA